MDMAPSDPLGTMDARLLGQTLGESYRVLRRIGAGGMGQVYEAEHTLLGRHFALKVLDTEQLTRRDAVQRFFAEARAASQIEHPHIVDVVHFVTDGPFTESKEVLGGYWMIEVNSLQAAIGWAKRCPASANEIIEIRQVQLKVAQIKSRGD